MAWSPQSIPDVSPVALSIDDDGLVVAGTSPSGSAPAAARLDQAGKATRIDLNPADADAASATVTSVAASGGTAFLVGNRESDADDGNRWTTWDGPLAGTVSSHPQPPSIFLDSDVVLGVVAVDDAPVIVAVRAGAAGPSAAIFTQTDSTWSLRKPAETRLTSRSSEVLAFSSLTTDGSRLLITGSATDASGSGQQTPMLFVGPPEGPWQAIVLPVPQGFKEGHVSRATSAACSASKDVCWIAGWAAGEPMVWTVDMSKDTSAIVLAADPISGDEPSPDRAAVVTVAGDVPVVFPNGDTPTALVYCDGGWEENPAPEGRVSVATGSTSTIYAVVEDSSDLAVTAAPTC